VNPLAIACLIFLLTSTNFKTKIYAQDSIPSSRVYLIDPNDPMGYNIDQQTPINLPPSQSSTYYDLEALDIEVSDRSSVINKGIEYKETTAPSQEKIKNPPKKGPGISFSDMAKSIQKNKTKD